MKRILTIGLLFLIIKVQGQDTLTLEMCYDLAVSNYPLTKQREMIDSYGIEEQRKLKKNFYPSASLNIQSKYQSDVINISPESTGAPIPINIEGEHDSYNATLDVKQLIWDGGITKYQRSMAEINTQQKQQLLESDLFKLKDAITQVYFNCILIDKQLNILEIALENLSENHKRIVSSYNNGVALKSDLQAIKAELLYTRQKIEEAHRNKQASLNVLSSYISKPVTMETPFIIPDNILTENYEIQRPEIEALKLNQQYLEISKKVAKGSRLPMISAFAQGGYGKPGLNMLSDEFDSYYILGVSLNWNLWDWQKAKNDKSMLSISSDIVETKIENLEQQITISAIKLQEEINKLENTLKLDEEIIVLRSEIKAASSSQLHNGVITSSDYIIALNDEIQAKLNYELHKIQMELAKIQLLNLYGQY